MKDQLSPIAKAANKHDVIIANWYDLEIINAILVSNGKKLMTQIQWEVFKAFVAKSFLADQTSELYYDQLD